MQKVYNLLTRHSLEIEKFPMPAVVVSLYTFGQSDHGKIVLKLWKGCHSHKYARFIHFDLIKK